MNLEALSKTEMLLAVAVTAESSAIFYLFLTLMKEIRQCRECYQRIIERADDKKE